MSSSQRPPSKPTVSRDALSQALLEVSVYAADDSSDDESPFTPRWIDFNPYGSDKEKNQENPGLQVESLPQDAEDFLRLAIAIFRDDTEDYPYKFQKEPSLNAQMKLVIRLCELGIEKENRETQEEMADLDLEQATERQDKFKAAFAATQKRYRLSHKGKGPTAKDRLLLEKRVRNALEAEELDSQIDQAKTKTRRYLPFPLNGKFTLFAAPAGISEAKRTWQDLDEEFLSRADLCIRLARQKMGNYIQFKGGQVQFLLIKTPRTAFEFFELAYALMDKSKTYKGAPVALDYHNNVWALKFLKAEHAANFLINIREDSDFLQKTGDRVGQLICALLSLKETAFSYSDLFSQGKQISLEQIKKAQEMEQAILRAFENLSKAAPKQEEEKRPAPKLAAARGKSPG